MLRLNDLFLVTANKNLILNDLELGYRADWAPKMPKHISGPIFFKSRAAIQKCSSRFNSEMKKGTMVGGVGWSKHSVGRFLGKNFYTISCGAVPKIGDTAGRIIHIHRFPSPYFGSINPMLLDNSVSHISFKERVSLLEKFDWYIKVDFKNGYR